VQGIETANKQRRSTAKEKAARCGPPFDLPGAMTRFETTAESYENLFSTTPEETPDPESGGPPLGVRTLVSSKQDAKLEPAVYRPNSLVSAFDCTRV